MSSAQQNPSGNSFTPTAGSHQIPGRNNSQSGHHGGGSVHRAPSAHGVRDLPGGGNISFPQQPISKTLPSATSQAMTSSGQQNFASPTSQFLLDSQQQQQNYRLSSAANQAGSVQQQQQSSTQPPPAYTRNSPDTRVIQAVPPFGLRDSTTAAISQHCLAESQVLKHLAREMQNSGMTAESLGMIGVSTSGLSVQSTSQAELSSANNSGGHLLSSGQIPLQQRQQQPVTGPLSPPPYQQSSGAQQLPDFVPTGVDGFSNQRGSISAVNYGQQQPIHHGNSGQNVYHNVRVNSGGHSDVGHTVKLSLSHPDLSRLQAMEAAAAAAAGPHQLSPQRNQIPTMPSNYGPPANMPISSNNNYGTDMVSQSFMSAQSHQQPTMYQESRYPSSTTSLSNMNVPEMLPQSAVTEMLSSGYSHMQMAGASNQQQQKSDIEALVNSRMMSVLTEENKSLRSQCDSYIRKTYKLQQLEIQYQKIHREYEELARRQEKREQLEREMQAKMQDEIARLRDRNSQLREQIEVLIMQLNKRHFEESDENDVRLELSRRDMMLAQLIPQNKEMGAINERQEIELAAQRATLEEQRTHIQILDKALNNAQEKVLKLEEECRKRQAQAERAEQLQKTLHQLQEAMQKREENHKRSKAQLEKELAQLQLQKVKETQNPPKKNGVGWPHHESDETIQRLKKEIAEKDEQVVNLQSKAVQWEEAYYQEVLNRESAVEKASEPKDAKIKALDEKNSQVEKLVSEARNESKKHLEEFRNAQRKVGELENKIHGLEARLAEKEAMIKVLRRHQAERAQSPSDRNRSSEDCLPDAWNHDSYNFGSLDKSRTRLRAVKARLVQSPSPARFSRVFHSKFSSIDAELVASSIRNSRWKDHARTQSSTDTTSYYLGGSGHGDSSSANYGLVDRPSYQREIYTLPAVRRSRNKIVDSKIERSVRPKSADEHLLTQGKSSESPVPKEAFKYPDTPYSPEVESVEKKNDKSNEQLWEV